MVPEPIFVFLTALTVWVFTEFYRPDEMIASAEAGNSLRKNSNAVGNYLNAADREIAQRFFELFSPGFQRTFDREVFPLEFHQDYLNQMRGFAEFSEHAWFCLSDDDLNMDMSQFVGCLKYVLKWGETSFDHPVGNIIEVRPDIYSQEIQQILKASYKDKNESEIVFLMLSENMRDCIALGYAIVARIQSREPDFLAKIMSKH